MISRRLGYPVDRPAAVWRRYGGLRPEAEHAIWCLHARIRRIKHGTALIIALPRAAQVRWGINGWQDLAEGETQDTGLGLQSYELRPASLSSAHSVEFTFQWRDTNDWVDEDFYVAIDYGN
jgi:glucoamylase